MKKLILGVSKNSQVLLLLKKYKMILRACRKSQKMLIAIFRRSLMYLFAVMMLNANVYADTFDLRDAVAALNIMENKLEYNKRLDLNLDGVVSFEDCIMILKELFNPATEESKEKDISVSVAINGKNFDIELSDTKAAQEFAALLPKTYDMSELNGNEKYVYTDNKFTAVSEKVGHINAGDIMLYGNNCIVLFYESFDTPYSYTKIGHITNPDGLKEIVGAGNITAGFSGK